MKKLLFIFCFLCACAIVEAQQLGSWRYYLPANSVMSVAVDDDATVYCGTRRSYLFSFDNRDRSIDNYYKEDGLAQAEVERLAWNNDYQLLVIAYQNADIDLWFEDEQVYLPSIRQASFQGSKTIQHISFRENLMYISCAFGIVVYDLDKLEVKDTYFLGEDSSPLSINASVIFDDKIFAAHDNGLLTADSNNPNLANVANWSEASTFGAPETSCNHLFSIDNSCYAAFGNELYAYTVYGWNLIYQASDNYIIDYIASNGNELALVEKEVNEAGATIDKAQIAFLTMDGDFQEILNTGDIRRPVELKADASGNYWLADEWNALLKISDREAKEWIRPNGPKSSNAHGMTFQDNTLWVAAGGVGPNGNIYLGRQAAMYKYETGKWNSYDQYNEPLLEGIIDILDIAPDPVSGSTWVSSYRNGLLEFSDGHFIQKFDKENSSLQAAFGDPESSRVRGIALDNKQNLWMCNHTSPEPIVVKTSDGIWRSFGGNLATNDLHDVLIDLQGNKWFATITDGIVVYNSGEDLLSTSDDQYVQYTKNNTELENDRINAMAIDREGQIWIGTKEGVYVVYCPYATFDGGCPPSRPTIENPETGELGYVLWFDFVRCIAIDAANRKWIGTTSGLWVFDADVREAVHNFTTDNSPLPDNDILSLTMNHETGEVFIGTAKGIVSYQNEAIEGGFTQNEDAVLVYPNPVRPGYEGDIAIKGLVENAIVKITDISGSLVHETQALGGQAIWNGYLLNGRRAASGVYFIYSTDDLGQEKYAGKFVIVN